MSKSRNNSGDVRHPFPHKSVMMAVMAVVFVLVLGLLQVRLQQENYELGEKVQIYKLELDRTRKTNTGLNNEVINLCSSNKVLLRAETMNLNLNLTALTQNVYLPDPTRKGK